MQTPTNQTPPPANPTDAKHATLSHPSSNRPNPPSPELPVVFRHWQHPTVLSPAPFQVVTSTGHFVVTYWTTSPFTAILDHRAHRTGCTTTTSTSATPATPASTGGCPTLASPARSSSRASSSPSEQMMTLSGSLKSRWTSLPMLHPRAERRSSGWNFLVSHPIAGAPLQVSISPPSWALCHCRARPMGLISPLLPNRTLTTFSS